MVAINKEEGACRARSNASIFGPYNGGCKLLRPVLKISPVYQTRKSNPNDNESDIWICGGAMKSLYLGLTSLFIYLYLKENLWMCRNVQYTPWCRAIET